MSYFDNDNNQYGGADDDDNDDGNDSIENSDIESEEEDEDQEKIEDEVDVEEENGEEEEVEDDDEDDEGEPDEIEEQSDEEPHEEINEEVKKNKKTKKIPAKSTYKMPLSDNDDDEDDEDGEQYLQKFDKSINNNYIVDFHPESILQNYDEILSMIKVIRDKDGIIVDDLHKTIPYLTKYERARILGQRAKQINSGATTFIKAPENVIDGYIIAELELKEKRIPFIIRRPLPNGGSEYWSIKDLEDISF